MVLQFASCASLSSAEPVSRALGLGCVATLEANRIPAPDRVPELSLLSLAGSRFNFVHRLASTVWFRLILRRLNAALVLLRVASSHSAATILTMLLLDITRTTLITTILLSVLMAISWQRHSCRCRRH
ncbi:hypothetical protein BKA62DRAFT_28307 [Auriculariales sp. MPI-PUGE-AT-0066]|nr:hypothetical protein BKA62DRAFT_28307 [Auriculariales sp. MPI-PUGE-AT-0066]